LSIRIRATVIYVALPGTGGNGVAGEPTTTSDEHVAVARYTSRYGVGRT